MKNEPRTTDLIKYKHELSMLESIKDYIQNRIDICIVKIEECKHFINTNNK